MLSVLTNSIPKEYLLPLAIAGSINKHIIFPTASYVADYLTVKGGFATEEELFHQHNLFAKNFQDPLNTIVNPIENKLIETVPGLDYALEFAGIRRDPEADERKKAQLVSSIDAKFPLPKVKKPEPLPPIRLPSKQPGESIEQYTKRLREEAKRKKAAPSQKVLPKESVNVNSIASSRAPLPVQPRVDPFNFMSGANVMQKKRNVDQKLLDKLMKARDEALKGESKTATKGQR